MSHGGGDAAGFTWVVAGVLLTSHHTQDDTTAGDGPAPQVSSAGAERLHDRKEGGSGTVFREPYFILDLLFIYFFDHLPPTWLREWNVREGGSPMKPMK